MAVLGSIRDVLVGESREDAEAKLDPRLRDVGKRQSALVEALTQTATGTGPTEGEQATMRAGRNLADVLAQQAQGRVAGARGFGRLAAQSEASRVGGAGVARVLSQAAAEAGKRRAQEQQQAQGLLAQVLQQQQAEREALLAERGTGILPALLATGGAVVGAKYGGTQGAAAGGQAGGSIGTSLSKALQ